MTKKPHGTGTFTPPGLTMEEARIHFKEILELFTEVKCFCGHTMGYWRDDVFVMILLGPSRRINYYPVRGRVSLLCMCGLWLAADLDEGWVSPGNLTQAWVRPQPSIPQRARRAK